MLLARGAPSRQRASGYFLPRWLVYSKPFFDDDPYVLEPGGYPNLKAWGAKDPSICSMHPIRLVSNGCWSTGAAFCVSTSLCLSFHFPGLPGGGASW